MPPKSSKALKLFDPRSHNIYINTSVTPKMRKSLIALTAMASEIPLTRSIQSLYDLFIQCEGKDEIVYLFENHFDVIEAATRSAISATISSHSMEDL